MLDGIIIIKSEDLKGKKYLETIQFNIDSETLEIYDIIELFYKKYKIGKTFEKNLYFPERKIIETTVKLYESNRKG